MSVKETDVSIGKMPDAAITEDMVAAARAMIGVEMRPERYIREASLDTLRNFVNGIGDINALFRDREYARWTRYGDIIAHPCFPYAAHYPGRTRWGFPGVHGFYGGTSWEFFGVWRVGDSLNVTEKVIEVEEKESQYSGKLYVQKCQTFYTNQRDELVAQAVGWCTRHERRRRERTPSEDVTSTEKGARKREPHAYPPEELARIDELVLAESPRGAEPRYWDDIVEGEDLTPVVRGPLSMMDTIGFLVASGRGWANGVLLREVMKHPGHYYRSGAAGGGIEYTGIGHMRQAAAEELGLSGAYDYGPQRISWVGSMLTNWMGDHGFLKKLHVELRGFNAMGDTQWIKGRVTRKYTEGGLCLLDCDVWCENQIGKVTAPGSATVILPTRSLGGCPVPPVRRLG